MYKKGLGILLAFCFVAGMTACTTTTEPPQNNDTAAGGETVQDSPVSGSEEYRFTYLLGGGNSGVSTDTPVGRVLNEKLNVVIDIESYAGDFEEKAALMLAGGDFPELLNLRTDDLVKKYIDAGAALDLGELAAQYAPNFLERHKETIPYWKMVSDDKKLYKFERNSPNYELVTGPQSDVLIRSDLLEAQGYPKLLTEDDYINFLKKAMADNPEINGQKTVGMTLPGAEAYGIQGIMPIMYEKGGFTTIAGNNAVIFDHKNDVFVDYMKHPYVKSSFRFFNRLYREGLLDPECFTDLSQQTTEKVTAGRALSAWYTVWYRNNANAALLAAGEPNMQYVIMPIMAQEQLDNGDKREIRILDSYAHGGMVVTKNCKNPQRMMELLDYAATEEGQVLLGWGIEGEDYVINDQGLRAPTNEFREGFLTVESYDDKRGIQAYEFLGLCNSFDANNQVYSILSDESVRNFLMTDRDKEVYANYGWDSIVDPWRKSELFDWETVHTGVASTISLKTGTDESRLAEKLVDFRVKSTVPLVMADSDEAFEQLYLETIAQYEAMNPESVVDVYNTSYLAARESIK